MFRQFTYDAFRVYRHPLEVETVNDVELFAPALAPRTNTVFDLQKLGAENRFDHIFAKQTIGDTFQVSLQREFIMARRDKPFDFDKSMIHASSLFRGMSDGNSVGALDRFVPAIIGG
jgi:hypothetical protein